MILPRFYPIVDSAAWVARVLAAGARLVQLRIKGRPPPELREEIRAARLLCERRGAQLVINDYWRLALDERCGCVHLGQEDLKEADLTALRAAGVRLGLSTHSEEELETALRASPDYVALGPIYPTSLKQMPWPPQGLERIGMWKQRIGALPLVAIGGLTVERAPAALAAGADSIAVVSDILRHPDPDARLRAWLYTLSMQA